MHDSRRGGKQALAWLVAALCLLALWQVWQRTSGPDFVPASPAVLDRAPARGDAASRADTDFLPPEAHETLRLIARGGPFPHRQDGGVFQNRERLLPERPRGYYREYTVPTPGARDRGARRIVTGGDPPEVRYYTADHYRSFRRIDDGAWGPP